MPHNPDGRAPRFPALLVLVALLAGCATPRPQFAAPVTSVQDLPATQAVFATTPMALTAGLAAACTRPGDRLVRISARSSECRSLMPPDAAAWAILTYDGVIEALPELVVNFTSRETEAGQALAIRTFLRVPQRRDAPKLIAIEDRSLTRRLQTAMARNGGTPLPD